MRPPRQREAGSRGSVQPRARVTAAAPAGAAAFGPSTAVAQSPVVSEAAAALRTVSTVWARVRSDMVCDGIRAPKISTWAAARPARAAGLSSDIHRPALSTALARDSSAAVGPVSASALSSAAHTWASSTARSAAAPA